MARLHNLLHSLTLFLVHTSNSKSSCWQQGHGVVSTVNEILSVETIEHCELAVRLIALQDQYVRSVSFVPKGGGAEGHCKMSSNRNFNKEDSAYFTLMECLTPGLLTCSLVTFVLLFQSGILKLSSVHNLAQI